MLWIYIYFFCATCMPMDSSSVRGLYGSGISNGQAGIWVNTPGMEWSVCVAAGGFYDGYTWPCWGFYVLEVPGGGVNVLLEIVFRPSARLLRFFLDVWKKIHYVPPPPFSSTRKVDIYPIIYCIT